MQVNAASIMMENQFVFIAVATLLGTIVRNASLDTSDLRTVSRQMTVSRAAVLWRDLQETAHLTLATCRTEG